MNVQTEEEMQATKDFISLVNQIRSTRGTGPIAWSTALKFLSARKYNVQRALELYQQHEIVRHREGLARLEPGEEPLRSELESGKFTVLPVRNEDGSAVALFSARLHYPLVASHQTTLQGVVYQLDVALESAETQRCGLVFVYDMSDSKYANFDYELSQKILTLLKGAYPARLKKVLIVTAPLWFLAPFKVLRLFVPEKLRDRVFTLKSHQLMEHLPLMVIPRELGGSHQVDHAAWLRTCFKTVASRSADLGDIGTHCEYSSLPTILRGEYEQEDTSLEHHDVNVEAETTKVTVSEVALVPVQREIERETSAVSTHAPLLVPIPPPIDLQGEEDRGSPAPPSSASSSGFSDDDSLADPPNGMNLHQLLHHLSAVGRKGLYGEYAEIKGRSPDGTFNNSRLRPNVAKNRYTDVLCYDHSRVTLEVQDADPSTDYINANFVDGYRQKRAFISTQGPIPKTAPDFWRMVWEQQCLLVVMLTRTVERGRPKCGQYWPLDDDSREAYGDFEVANLAVENQPDFVITNLHLMNLKTRETRTVIHMQFSSWPDYGVPHSALAFLDFLQKIRDSQSAGVAALGELWTGHPLGPPIIVHCSAGIGRTGTLCTIDICLQRLQDVGSVDVRGTVEKLRAQRAYSIQMPDQYVFCHLAIIEAALSMGLLDPEVIDLTGFDSEGEED